MKQAGAGLVGWVAGLVENKANSARPAKLELFASWGWVAGWVAG